MVRLACLYVAAAALLAAGGLIASAGETGALPQDRLSQAEIASGDVRLDEIRRQGLVVFSTPFAANSRSPAVQASCSSQSILRRSRKSFALSWK